MRRLKGFTLIESMVSMVIFGVIMLGSVKALSNLYHFSADNTMRDDAVRLADEILTDYRNIPYGDALMSVGAKSPVIYRRQISNASVTYTTEVTISEAVSNVAKSIAVKVSWNALGKAHSGTTTTIVANK